MLTQHLRQYTVISQHGTTPHVCRHAPTAQGRARKAPTDAPYSVPVQEVEQISLHAVERMLYELNRDALAARRFRDDPQSVLAGRDLSADERRMLESGDVLALYRYGVHPLLLAPASRFFGLDQSAFRAALAPAIGERTR